jgi:FAD/FMN-containing dehydrogenase
MPVPSSGAATLSISALRNSVKGRVIAPGDEEYDEARTVFLGGIDRRPAVIIQVVDTDDVAKVVALAGDSGLELAIRSGGHSVYAVSDGGIVLDLAGLKSFEIDADGRTAWAGSGLTAAEYTGLAAARGLATGFGDTGSVGIGGITLGGGVGYLVRKYGLTIDNLLAAEIVTADGELLRIDEHDHPDLFWAIRGGGGNFGVVTRFKFRLHKIETIVGGMMILPATPEVIAGFIGEAEVAPDELSTIANVMPAPPMPFLPEEQHGLPVVMALMAYAGEVEAGELLMDRFRALAEPIVDMVKAMPYPEIYPPDEEGYHPIAAGRTMFIDSVDEQSATSILEYLATSSAMMKVAQLRVLGGAMSRVPVGATAFAHRTSPILVNLAAVYGSPEEADIHETWVAGFASSLAGKDSGAYVGFLDEGEGSIHRAYPGPTLDRLKAVKRRYDPTNVFRFNHNVSPE